MSRILIPLLVTLPLAACGDADFDGDGLTNAEEKDFGSKIRDADSDGDGATDFEEFQAGSDPTLEDSDGDGMSDGDEILYGRDAVNPKVGFYEGGWPMTTVLEKEALDDAKGSGRTAKLKKQFPRLTMKDQYGDKVDLYDLALQGQMIVLDFSAEWCGPCHAMAETLDGQSEAYGPEVAYAGDLVRSGDLRWVTMIFQDQEGAPADKSTLKRWHDLYPTPNVPVLNDGDGDGTMYADSNTIPHLILVDENFIIQAIGTDDVLYEISQM